MTEPKHNNSNAKGESTAEKSSNQVREVTVKIELRGGHHHEVILKEDATELRDIFRAMVSKTQVPAQEGEWFFQLPMDHGQAACSFLSSQIVSVITRPPVLISVEALQLPANTGQAALNTSGGAVFRSPNYAIIDDFLSPDEHQSMLDYALENEDKYEKGTVTSSDEGYRSNLVIMGFGDSIQAKYFANRLLVMLPVLLRKLGKTLSPVESVECQLTASNDGHYFKNHMDSSAEELLASRYLTCVYYFNRRPRNYTGGQLRIYDTIENSGQSWSGTSYREIEPKNNRLVVFPSNQFHELRPIRCPSGKFEDSRFAISSWIRSTQSPDPEARLGFGYYSLAKVPAAFR